MTNPSANLAIRCRSAARRRFYIPAGVSLLLVLLIAADGMLKGIDTIIPDYYRHKASLAIAISELAQGTSGFVGLVEVEQALDKAGLGMNPDIVRMTILHAHPEQIDAALRAAADLSISDRSKTFGLMLNETGMIDYYYVAFKLFGYHVRSIYALYIGILGVMALCFIGSFRQRAIFIVPSILYLLLLLAEQHGLTANDFGFGPLTNSRLLPLLSLYPVLFCLTLVACGRGFRTFDMIGAAIAGVIFAFVVDARTYAYWQIGPLIAVVVLIIAARILPWRLQLRARLARFSLYPMLAFALCAGLVVGNHHWRRDASVYSTATFTSHGYWLAYVISTMPAFRWRIPELERESGVAVTEGDSYGGALLRIKIRERGERLEDYLTGDWWNERMRDSLARQIAFDLWREYPLLMIENYVRAFKPVAVNLVENLGLIAFAIAAVSIGLQSALMWLLRILALIAIDGITGAAVLAATALPCVWPTSRRLSTLMVPVALLGLSVIPTIIIMPFTDTRVTSDFSSFTDSRMVDVNFAVLLCLLVCLCGARLRRHSLIRFGSIAEDKYRSLPREAACTVSRPMGLPRDPKV